MKSKTTNWLLFILSLLGIGAGYFIFYPEKIGICPSSETINCLHPLEHTTGEPLFLGSVALTIILLILLFFRKEIFHSWSKFGIWFVPLAFVLIAITPQNDFLLAGRDAVVMFLSIIFIIISLIIIAWKSWSLRSRKEAK